MPAALVTGATGFVGTNLVAKLLDCGWQVHCLVRDVQKAKPLEQAGATLHQGSLGDLESLRQAMADIDTVFHVAGRVRALNELQFTVDNVEGTRGVVAVAAEQAKPPVVVLVSSLAAGGPSMPGTARRETDTDRPVSAYGESKLAAERAAAQLADTVPISIVRPPIIFGPADKASLAIFRGVKFTRLHPVPGYRRFPVSVVHVDDLCEAMIRIAQRGQRLVARKTTNGDQANQGIYYVAAERTIPYGELGKLAGQSLGCAAIPLPIPKALFWIAGGAAELFGQIRRQPTVLNLDKIREAVAPGWECSDDKLRQELDYQPAAPLEERFAETTAWYRKQGWL